MIMAGEKRSRSKHKHANVQLWQRYKGGKAEGKSCPRCGAGVHLAEHKNRSTCGKCRYSEIKKQ